MRGRLKASEAFHLVERFGPYLWTYQAAALARLGRHYYAGMPPFPAGKVLRRAEHYSRWLAWKGSRQELLSLLRAHFRTRAGLVGLPPKPPHGRACPPGCVQCAARLEWRRQMAAAVGLLPTTLEGLV